jgi:Rrf2 family protein
MKVSRRTEYGLRAIVTLAERTVGGHAVPLREIAAVEDIPEPFLDQIFALLRREGIVQSVRGATGGYLLAREPGAISMGQIVRVLEGGIAPMGCVGDDLAAAEEFCGKAGHCHTRSVWVKLYASIQQTLDAISLAEVMESAGAAAV